MIRLSDGNIGTREFTSIVMFMIGIKFTDTTPDLLFHYGQNAAWMMPIISYFIIMIPFLVLLSLLKKHHDQGLMELLFRLTGKYFSVIIGFALFVMLLADTTINIRNYIDIVNTMYYQRTPVPFLLLMLLGVCFFVANRGLETLGRICWIVLPYIQVIVLLLIVFVWREADIMHLFPLGGPGLKQIIRQSAAHSSALGEIIFLTALFPFVRKYKDFRFGAIVGFSFACLQMAVFTAVYVCIFDYPAVDQLVYPYHQLARAAAIGQSITNVEALFFFFWIISTIVHFALLLYVTVFIFAKMIRMNEFEPLLLPFAGLTFLLGLTFDNVVVANLYRDIVLKSSTYLLLGLPFLLWLLDRWKGRRLNYEAP